jgi:AcrR family transcriptional regulator
VASEAAAAASVDGLAGMTLSQLANGLGVTKSSIQAAFATKEELQLAAVAAASETFLEAVVSPALDSPEGLPRLMALVDAWLGYVERRVFPGGCFMVATLSEFDSRPGPVRDEIARARRGWLRLLSSQIAIGQSTGEIPASPSADALAFEVDALLSMANVDRNLNDDTTPLEIARDLIALRLGSPARGKRTRKRQRADRP